MNADSAGQDPEISQRSFIRLTHPLEVESEQKHTENCNEEYAQHDPYSSFASESYNFSIRTQTPTSVATNSGRNKRKNFNPRYTSTSPMGEEYDESPSTMNTRSSNFNLESADDRHYQLSEHENVSRSSKSPVSPGSRFGFSGAESLAATIVNSGDSTMQQMELPPWVQILNRYEQLVKAAGMAQYQAPSDGGAGGGSHDVDGAANTMQAAVSDMSEWVKKFGSNESAVSAIRDILKVYQGRRGKDSAQDGNGNANLSTETEPPTPPTTPHTCNPSRSIIPNGNADHHQTPAYQSPLRNSQIKEEILHPSPPHLAVTAADSVVDTNNSKNQRDSPLSESLPQPIYQWCASSASRDEYSHREWKKKESSGDDEDDNNYTNKTAKIETDTFNRYQDDSSDCYDRQQASGGSSSHQLRQWCEDFRKIPESIDKRVKSECDDTDTTVGDADNNLYYDDDYSPSPNDFPDSANDDEDEDDGYSMNIFCDDDQSTAADDHMRTTGSSEGATENPTDPDDRPNLIAEKEGSCSNSSSKISNRNLGEFFEQSQLNLVPSKSRGVSDEKSLHSDFVPNMSKFTSYIECQDEMCRLENLREHYHCYDFPCFGKILSKKEEVIRHVKWHRKRMESLNHGFLRFSSSDDCSTTFGSSCQHNRKQTHYHCFQPKCDRVYISTSDVQMHSNFHRKDSAIHKEGFQRYRANEVCSADYCMFAGQKTTHFHCRRDNCRYTFKNKADMEKHKTYHIKDLKLARDGFKKFLKNEPCPYTQCRFSKVCNHIHCARENCFYVLHSSGQLLSHKRKHERMDNEQTYCRYKMLAVKAALLGNAAAAAVSSPDRSPYNLTNSLLQLRELEISALMPGASTEPPPLPSPKQEAYSKDSAAVTESPASSSLSVEFLQQMKKRHEEILKQNQHHPTDSTSTAVGVPAEVSIFPVAQQTTDTPQHQYNMALDHTHLTPSIIQQFFSTDCLNRKIDIDEPINLRNLPPSEERFPTLQKPSCPWMKNLEPHLHCIVKDCEAVIPNNVLDISAHIRKHGYNRDVYATTAAADPLLSAGTGTSNNPMQITTIDGFFNRKRGRPPKNRFVEVYKNAQQSPQAIFTSFKLEKQTTNKDCNSTCDPGPSLSYNPSEVQQKPPTGDEQRLRSLSSPQSLGQATTTLVQNPIASQFTTHKANERCRVLGGGRCSLAMQHHYHCACTAECTFITVERDLLSVHLERQHTFPSFADRISKMYKRFDRTIGLDCEIIECRLRKTRPHLHCRQCYRQISPLDLETHSCIHLDRLPIASSPTKKSSTFYSPEYSRNDQQIPPDLPNDNLPMHAGKHLVRNYACPPSVTFSTLNELRRKVSEMEPETNAPSKRAHEEDKVLVVRAAGTYFPENTTELNGSSSQTPQKPSASTTATDCSHLQGRAPSTSAYCSIPYCKLKRKPHEHCELCDQSFTDPAKSKAHRLKHKPSTITPMPAHLMSLHSIETNEEIKQTVRPRLPSSGDTSSLHLPVAFDDQPQDLSLSPNATTTIQDDRMHPNIETFTATSQHPTSVPGQFPNIFPPDFMNSISMQNFHLAQLATLYQQNPYYYQHLYPFLSNAAALTRYQRHRQAQSYRGNDDKPYLPSPSDCPKAAGPAPLGILTPRVCAPPQFPFLNPLLMARSAETLAPKQQIPAPPVASMPSTSAAAKSVKRKLSNGSDDFNTFIDTLSPSTKKQMQFAAGLAAAAAAAATTATTSGNTRTGSSSSNHDSHGQHFKIKDEQIPTGYLKFRFNEDCYFPKCGYRNHQSHFHCDRNDCHYSFCDKTRFVQHTARHERLDKLMGNDFRQYRANMNCGYENCPYFKNLGSANKSSHFHCLKCDFICSDTNKVVAHRRQHSKMEYIRMAGFRKVTNSEKCNSTFEATVPTNGNDVPGTIECSYSQKQTHYHCLVCDVSVLSRAQLPSHKHKT